MIRANKWVLILVLAVGLGESPSLRGAAAAPLVVEPTAPAHHFFNAQTICLQAFAVIAMAADVASTRQALRAPGAREMNPLAQSQGALIALKVAGAGAALGMAYIMHRKGHYKAARVIPLIFGVPSALAAAHNFSIHH